MRTLTFAPNPNVIREAVTHTTVAGLPGFSHRFDAMPRPMYRFSLQLGPIYKFEVECLSALHAFHQGRKSFFWDGGWYGNMSQFMLAGEGDGSRQDFLVPNRYLGHANSISVRTLRPSTGASSDWVTATFTTWLNPGLIKLSTAAASGDLVQAKYSCFYCVTFASDGLSVDQVATDLYTVRFDLFENPLLISERPEVQISINRITLAAGVTMTPAITRNAVLLGSQLLFRTITARLRGTPNTSLRIHRPTQAIRAAMSELASITRKISKRIAATNRTTSTIQRSSLSTLTRVTMSAKYRGAALVQPGFAIGLTSTGLIVYSTGLDEAGHRVVAWATVTTPGIMDNGEEWNLL